jgi:spermidine synthase
MAEQQEAKAEPGTLDDGLGVVKDGWFTELSTMWPGQGLSLEVDEVMFRGRSTFQDVALLRTKAFGRVLVLDGVIQTTDRDEFSYQEMITHLALCALPEAAKKVLIVGGGDGGVAREVTRHASVEVVDQAEIDEMVPEISKQHLPELSLGFKDPRVNLRITDGIKWVTDVEEGTYDAIIVDSSDPVGPAEVLFEEPFFRAMHRALKPGGIVCTQAESLWLHLPIITELATMCHRVFAGGSVQYAYTTIPTYPSGQIGFMICSKKAADGSALDTRVSRQPPPQRGDYPPLRYYNAQLHAAAFVLPQFAVEALANSMTYA